MLIILEPWLKEDEKWTGVVMTDFLRVDARMALARYESSVAAFGMEAGFLMKDVYAVKEYIERLEASETEWQPICDSYAAENQRFSDRIEKLEAALRFYACDCKPDDGCGIEYYDGGAYCGYTARKALEGKDD